MSSLSTYPPRSNRPAAASRRSRPAPSDRSNRLFIAVLSALFVLSASLFLFLIYAVLLG